MKAEVANERTDVVDASEIVLDWYLAILGFGGGKISFLLRDFRSASSLDQDAFRGWWDWKIFAEMGRDCGKSGLWYCDETPWERPAKS